MNNKELALKAASILTNKKATDVVVIDITEKSSFADYLVIASGNSERQISALSEEVIEQLAKENILPKNVEGKSNSGWILMDYADVIINVFSIEQRNHYNIEKIWSDCNFLDLEDEDVEG
ncbi:MAG: ribosome silencing factor [Anaerovoracaceae bacterium]|jgi:ribosome-associated protein